MLVEKEQEVTGDWRTALVVKVSFVFQFCRQWLFHIWYLMFCLFCSICLYSVHVCDNIKLQYKLYRNLWAPVSPQSLSRH